MTRKDYKLIAEGIAVWYNNNQSSQIDVSTVQELILIIGNNLLEDNSKFNQDKFESYTYQEIDKF